MSTIAQSVVVVEVAVAEGEEEAVAAGDRFRAQQHKFDGMGHYSFNTSGKPK
jgi:hypothetical protein